MVLAITIGFVLGLVITFGIWVANKSLKQSTTTKITPTPTSPVASLEASLVPTSQVVDNQLSITSPEDESITATNSVTVSGKSFANTPVAILYEDGQMFTTAGSDGKFEVEVPLVGGYNEITATAVDNGGLETTQTITVTYSTAKI